MCVLTGWGYINRVSDNFTFFSFFSSTSTFSFHYGFFFENSTYNFLKTFISSVNEHAASQEYAITIKRSKKNQKNEIRKMWMQCDQKNFEKRKINKRESANRRNECFFTFIVQRNFEIEKWNFVMTNFHQNHFFILAGFHFTHREIAMIEKIKKIIEIQIRINFFAKQILFVIRLNVDGKNFHQNSTSAIWFLQRHSNFHVWIRWPGWLIYETWNKFSCENHQKKIQIFVSKNSEIKSRTIFDELHIQNQCLWHAIVHNQRNDCFKHNILSDFLFFVCGKNRKLWLIIRNFQTIVNYIEFSEF